MLSDIKAKLTLNLKAGKATSAPPVGSMLSQFNINLTKFCKEYNEKTKDYIPETIIPVLIIIYKDFSYLLKIKSTPISILIKQNLNLTKVPKTDLKEKKIGTISINYLKELATYKLIHLNTNDINKAIKIITGTVKNMKVHII